MLLQCIKNASMFSSFVSGGISQPEERTKFLNAEVLFNNSRVAVLMVSGVPSLIIPAGSRFPNTRRF